MCNASFCDIDVSFTLTKYVCCPVGMGCRHAYKCRAHVLPCISRLHRRWAGGQQPLHRGGLQGHGSLPTRQPKEHRRALAWYCMLCFVRTVCILYEPTSKYLECYYSSGSLFLSFFNNAQTHTYTHIQARATTPDTRTCWTHWATRRRRRTTSSPRTSRWTQTARSGGQTGASNSGSLTCWVFCMIDRTAHFLSIVCSSKEILFCIFFVLYLLFLQIF